jgi:hypothetical protein
MLCHKLTIEFLGIKIDVWDMDPSAFMDFLGFTDEQRNWAELLESTIRFESE